MGEIDQNKVIYTDEFRGPNKEVRVLSVFCYIPLVGIFTPKFLDSTIKKPNSAQASLSENDFVRFHLVQAYVLFGSFLVWLFLINFSLCLLLYILLVSIHGYYAYKWEAFRFWWIRKIFPVDVKIMALSVSAIKQPEREEKKQ